MTAQHIYGPSSGVQHVLPHLSQPPSPFASLPPQRLVDSTGSRAEILRTTMVASDVGSQSPSDVTSRSPSNGTFGPRRRWSISTGSAADLEVREAFQNTTFVDAILSNDMRDEDGTETQRRDKAKRAQKLLQLLGEGAVAASMDIAEQQQMYRDALTRRARAEDEIRQGRRRGVVEPSHMRGASLDSLSSSRPSISGSINTLTPLLAGDRQRPDETWRPPVRSDVHPSVNPQSSGIRYIGGTGSQNVEDPVQVQMKTRALEKRLGEKLVDHGNGRLSVQPPPGSTVLVAEIEDWSPPDSANSIPEWARDDVVPHVVEGSPTRAAPERQASSGKKARMALGFGRHRTGREASEGTNDLKVFVERQVQITQTSGRSGKHQRNKSVNRDYPVEEVRVSSEEPRSSLDWALDEEEMLERVRTRRFAKLQKLIDENKPALPEMEFISPTSNTLTMAKHQDTTASIDASCITRADTPVSDEVSFFEMEETPSSPLQRVRHNVAALRSPVKGDWTTRLKRSMSKSRQIEPRRQAGEESFINFAKPPAGFHHSSSLSKSTSKKLPRLPDELEARHAPLSPSHRHADSDPSPSGIVAQQAWRGFERDYSQSSQGLIYLADNDLDHVGEVKEALDESKTAHSSSAPATPIRPWVNRTVNDQALRPSQSMKNSSPRELARGSSPTRRRRAEKLAHFFGEDGIDFTAPNVPAPRLRAEVNIKTPLKGRARIEKLERVLGEPPKGVQADSRDGRMRWDEMNMLGDMLGGFRSRAHTSRA